MRRYPASTANNNVAVVLGVDGGNTKTIALTATSDGSIVGGAIGICTDIYGAESAEAAVAELERLVLVAYSQAGVKASQLTASVFNLAGADWPEDYAFLTNELSHRFDLARPPVVMNDALGPLDIGTDDGVGISLVCGTFPAIGARGPSGHVWHSSFWAEPGGAHGLGSMALRAAYRAELGLAPITSLAPRLHDLYDVQSTEEMLHRFTRRVDPVPDAEVVRAARVLLDEAAQGDPVALGLVDEHASLLCRQVVAAARRVGLPDDFVLVLAGGIFAHEAHLLESLLASWLAQAAPAAQIVVADLPPAAGAILRALRTESPSLSRETRARVVETVPQLDRSSSQPKFQVNRRHA